VGLLQKYLDYFDKKYPDYCKRIFQVTLKELGQDLKKNNILVLYMCYQFALYPRNNDLLTKYLIGGDAQSVDLSNKIQFYTFVFRSYFGKYPDIQFLKAIKNQVWLVTKSKKWIELKSITPEEIKQLETMFKKPPEIDDTYSSPVKKNLAIHFQELRNKNLQTI